jgi:hypothetical protein
VLSAPAAAVADQKTTVGVGAGADAGAGATAMGPTTNLADTALLLPCCYSLGCEDVVLEMPAAKPVETLAETLAKAAKREC